MNAIVLFFLHQLIAEVVQLAWYIATNELILHESVCPLNIYETMDTTSHQCTYKIQGLCCLYISDWAPKFHWCAFTLCPPPHSHENWFLKVWKLYGEVSDVAWRRLAQWNTSPILSPQIKISEPFRTGFKSMYVESRTDPLFLVDICFLMLYEAENRSSSSYYHLCLLSGWSQYKLKHHHPTQFCSSSG